MKKNILAENMKRFATKNLSESDLTKIDEQSAVQKGIDAEIAKTKNELNTKFSMLKGKHGNIKGAPTRNGKMMGVQGKVAGRNYFEVDDLIAKNEGGKYPIEILFKLKGYNDGLRFSPGRGRFLTSSGVGAKLAAMAKYYMQYYPKTIAKLKTWGQNIEGGIEKDAQNF